MHRTQLYLEEDLWSVLQSQARSAGSSVSELVRQALRERFVGKSEERKQAMRDFIGIRRGRPEFDDAESYVRGLRRDDRLERLR